MHRACYNPIKFDGFNATSKVESVAMASGGNRMFVGTGDGNLLVCECRMDNTQQYTVSSTSVIRKSKERKAVYSALKIYESWRIIVGIIDGIIMVYDTQTCQCICQLLDSKNCTLFSVHEGSSIMAVANKRKVSFYSWQGQGFVPQREMVLGETPKFLHCISGAVIIGYRKTYELISLSNFNSTHLLDVDKEHAMVGADIPTSIRRGACVLLSVGNHGMLIENIKNRPSLLRERVEWSAAPLAARAAAPFNLVSLLSSNVVEIHDMASLNVLQTISIADTLGMALPSGASLCMNICKARKSEEHVFVSTGDKIAAYTMIPVPNQIMSLTADGHYEEALELYNLSPKEGSVLDVQIFKIHAMYAHVLHGKGDFEGAIHNFISAQSNPAAVLSLFPEFVPAAFLPFCKDAAAQSTAFVKAAAQLDAGESRSAMTGGVLARAAAAVATFCEHHRDATAAKANAAERIKSAGIGASAEDYKLTGLMAGDDASTSDGEDLVRVAELVDSTLLTTLVNCSPPRIETVVAMLSKTNRCHSESSAVMLASRGKSFTEALLWLYRSNGEHRRVLAALTKERCVDSGAWTMEQYQSWVADYLRWLWFSDDATLPPLALQSLRHVLEYDGDLGMGVLILRPRGRASFGGKGVTVNEVITFLSSVKPCENAEVRQVLIAQAQPHLQGMAALHSSQKKVAMMARKHRAAHVCGGVVTPLINGAALGISYLEWLVSTGAAPQSMHDEFAHLLVKSIPMQSHSVDHSKNDLLLIDGEHESASLYKIYRQKLQYFLENSGEYRPDKVAKFLPPDFMHEHALLLSLQGKHEEVIRVYINRLKDLALATSYCDRIYKKLMQSDKKVAGNLVGDGEDSVYLCLFRVILAADDFVGSSKDKNISGDVSAKEKNLQCVIRVAEQVFERFSPTAFLALVQPTVPLAQIASYLNIIIEYTNTKKKSLKVLHQIMRMREVNLRTEKYGGA